MLDEDIQDDEYLYRRVITNPSFWDFDKNRPSSAIFKDSKGVSVDRQNKRKDSDVINLYEEFPIRAIVKVLTEKCRLSNTFPVYKPTPENVYHSEIHDSTDKVQLSSSKAKKLRDNSLVIYIKD